MGKSVKKSHLRLTGQAYLETVLPGGTASESRDCTVRAIEKALDIPYWQAHRYMAKAGNRRLKTGGDIWSALGTDGRVLFGNRIGKIIHPKKTVKTFLKQHPTGTFIIGVSRHAFAVRDGKLLNWVKSKNQHIEYYWRVTKIEKPVAEKLENETNTNTA
jgi:hypothetical protein